LRGSSVSLGMTEPRVRFLLASLPRPASRAARVAALAVATIGPLVAALALATLDHHPPAAVWVPVVLLGLSALLAHHGAAGSQILARGVWWSNLVLGTLLSFFSSGGERSLGLLLATAVGVPLLAMGRMGLDEDERSAFRPVAFRTTLTLAMTMAVADVQALLFWGLLKIEDGGGAWAPLSARTQGILLLVAAAMIGVAIAGLYRLRVWGLLFGALCAAGLIGLMASDVCGLKTPLSQSFVVTSAVQLLLPAPILAAIVRGRAPAPRAPSRLARLAPALVVAALMALSAAAVVSGHDFR
jgi:hypothetical protein